MAILFGTTRNNFPDFFSGSNTPADQLFNFAEDTLGKVLSIAGARVFNGSFVEDGVQSVNGSAFVGSTFSDLVEPSRRQFLSQAPQATVLIKKRMFSTLRTNYDVRFMDADERLYMRAVKNLLRRKCEEIAFYENLVNLKKIVSDPSFLTTDGVVQDLLQGLGITASSGASLDFAISSLVNSLSAQFPFLDDLQNLAKINQRAKQNKYTTWVVDPDQPDFSGTGPGVGVIELTMATNISTTVSLNTGSGKCSFTIEDPYQISLITEADADYAVRQARSEQDGQAGFLSETAQNNLRDAATIDADLNVKLRERGASEVNFDFPLGPNALPVLTIVRTNQIVQMDNIGQIGFDSVEQAMAQQIFDLLQSYKTLQDRTSGILLESTAQSNKIRQKIRSEFVGQHIIQQMDAVHVFLNSFTRNETPIYANRSDLLLGELADAIVTPEEQEGRISDEALDQERSVLAPNLPLFIYKLLRNPAEWRGTGPQVFSGLVDGVQSSYQSTDKGRFTLTINAVDNTKFLDLSQINTTPSLEQPEGVLMDPLTPYDLIQDPSSGLIVGKQLNQVNASRLKFLKFDNGVAVEKEENLINDTGEGNSTTIYSLQHVPGLVYKWKTGIVTATLNANLTRTLDRSQGTVGDISNDFGIHTLGDQVFSNLDAADIMSILITGQPYNYNTFIRNALMAGTFSVDTDTNSRLYFNTLFDHLDRQPTIWGGFVPAKASVIDPEKSADLFRRQRDITRTLTKVNDLQRELARLKDQQLKLGQSESTFALKDGITKIESLINQQLANLQTSDLFSDQSSFKFYGNSVQVEYTPDNIRDMSNRLKYIVKKKPEEVRFNQDKNYFIVSDKYDTDLDIQAFVLQLKNNSPELFKSDWKRPITICQDVATMLDFEFFADSQGNIQFRPPQYNRTPLSLMLKMAQLGRSDGISLAPPFLLQLLSSRLDLMRNKLLGIELQILEKGTLLQLDQSAIQAQFGLRLALIQTTQSPTRFALDDASIVLEGNKSSIFTEDEQQTVVFKSTPGGAVANAVDVFAPFAAQVFTSSSSTQLIIDIRNQIAEIQGSTQAKLQDDSATHAKIAEELRLYDPSHVGSFTNRLTLANDISQLISQRQAAIVFFYKLSQDASQLNAANDGLNLNSWNIIPEALGSLIDGGNTDQPSMPRFLEDLVENDFSNFDGFNSGKRFIINDDVILTMNFSFQNPQFTRIDVTGNQNFVDFSGVAGQIGSGAAVQWAGATDFDLWRQFGYRGTSPHNQNKSFLQDAETQCAPYAVFKLVQQRKKLYSGTLTIVGNEHYQVGDVVYINSRQMLYYVEEVSHSLDVSHGKFTTTLSLTYGHALGDYIPTPLDMIGKGLLAGPRQQLGNIKVVRTLVPSDTIVVLGTLVAPNNNPIEPDFSGSLANPQHSQAQSFETINSKQIQNIIQRALLRLTSSNKNLFKIEIRSYYSTDALQPDFTGSVVSAAADAQSTAAFYAVQAQALLIKGSTPKPGQVGTAVSQHGTALGLDSTPPLDLNPLSNNTLTADKIVVIPPINISSVLTGDDLKFRRMPSEQAWANALDAAHGTQSGLPINSIDVVLVIDKSVNPDGETEESKLNRQISEAAAQNITVSDTISAQDDTLETISGQASA